jgi:hypothetical protein
MATKEAVFNVKVNTGNSVKDVQDLDKSLDNLNKATDETTKSTRDVNATFEQVYGELQPLTTRLGEAEDRLYELALAGQQASDEYKELLETVSNYRKTQIAVDATVDASAQTMSQKLVSSVEFGASAFQAYESAVALAGVESEALVQTMVKLQAIQGLVGSIRGLQEGLGTVTPLFTKLRTLASSATSKIVEGFKTMTASSKAFALTGVGLAVTAIGYLVSAFSSATESASSFTGAIDQSNAVTEKAVESASAELSALDKLQKQMDDETLTREEKNKAVEELQKKYPSLLSNINAEKLSTDQLNSAISTQIDLSNERARVQASEALRAEKFQGLIQEEIKQKKIIGYLNDELRQQGLKELDVNASLNEIYEAERDLIEEVGVINLSSRTRQARKSRERLDALQKEIDQLDELGKASKKNLTIAEDGLKQFQEDAEARKKAEKEAEERRRRGQEAYKKRVAERLALEKKLAEEEQKRLFNIQALENEFLNELEALDEEHYQRTLTAQEKEETAVNDKYFRLIETAKQYGMDTADLEAKQQIELLDIRKKYDAEALKTAQEREQKLADMRENFNALFRDQFEQRIVDARKANQEEIKELEEAHKEGVISDGEFYIARLKLANDLADKEKEIERDKNEYIKQQQIKAREEQLEGITKVIEGAQKGLDSLSMINDLANQIDQARLNSIQNKRDENLENLDRNLEAQLNNENLTAEQKAQIEENFAQQKFAIQQKAFEEEEKIKRAQFNRDKALKLAQVSIDTASAIVKAIAQFGPPPSPLGIAGIASAGVIGLTQALAILNQQYQGGSAPSPPQVGGGGASAGALTGAGASTFTANTQAEQTDLSTIGQDVPVSQVVVLESDITGTQSKVAVQEAKSSF